jgi:hypothetical protein
MRLGEPHPYIDPEAAAPKLMGIANSTEPVQDGRIHIELFNRPFLQKHRGYKAGLHHRTRLALETRERHLRENHPGSTIGAAVVVG